MTHDLDTDNRLTITAENGSEGFDLAALQAKLQQARADYLVEREGGEVRLTVRLGLLSGPRGGKARERCQQLQDAVPGMVAAMVPRRDTTATVPANSVTPDGEMEVCDICGRPPNGDSPDNLAAMTCGHWICDECLWRKPNPEGKCPKCGEGITNVAKFNEEQEAAARQYLTSHGWRESTLSNDRDWWIDPLATCFVHHTRREAVAIQRKRDAGGTNGD